jgi:N-dimethylarginine dimethylaminohydrolase
MRLVALAGALIVAGAHAAPAPAEEQGAITTWVLHFDAEMRVACLPAYRDLLRAFPADARVVVGVTTAEDGRVFRDELDLKDPRLCFVEAGEWVSGWARDRYIIFARGGKRCLLLPRRDAVAPTRLGDLAVAQELKRIAPELEVIESDLVLEGGNVLVTAEEVIVGPEALSANEGMGGAGARERIERAFGRRLVVAANADSPLAAEHVDMYLAVAGPRTLLLGDPRAGAEALADGEDVRAFGSIRRERLLELAEEYDRIEARLVEEEFEVKRIPILHADDRVIVTWTNAVAEARDGKRRVYLPCYGLKRLDRAAQDAWEALGFEAVPISAEALIVLGGGVRCITNTLREAPPPPPPADRDG